MKVLVTGGTGFVGAHAVAAAVRAGHDVRLLVRRPEQVDVSLAPLGVGVRDVVVGRRAGRTGRSAGGGRLRGGGACRGGVLI